MYHLILPLFVKSITKGGYSLRKVPSEPTFVCGVHIKGCLLLMYHLALTLFVESIKKVGYYLSSKCPLLFVESITKVDYFLHSPWPNVCLWSP